MVTLFLALEMQEIVYSEQNKRMKSRLDIISSLLFMLKRRLGITQNTIKEPCDKFTPVKNCIK